MGPRSTVRQVVTLQWKTQTLYDCLVSSHKRYNILSQVLGLNFCRVERIQASPRCKRKSYALPSLPLIRPYKALTLTNLRREFNCVREAVYYVETHILPTTGRTRNTEINR